MRIVIVAHKLTTQPDDELVLYLNRQEFDHVLHIRHSFSDAPDRCSYYTWYQKGKIYQEYRTKDYKNLPEVLIYLKELFFTLKWTIEIQRKIKDKWSYYIGMDGLCVFFGNILRFFGFTRKTVFWAIDFVPKNRFGSFIKDKIYSLINTFSYKQADQVWDLSPRMAEAREKFANLKKTDYKLLKLVNYGIWLDRIQTYSYNECQQNTLVFMGHLTEKQGVQLVLQTIPEIVKRNPLFQFKIIGDGNFKNELIKLVENLGIRKYCNFLGKIDKIEILEDEVARSCLAIAPYIAHLDTFTYYADPGKVKTYIGCGVPLLLTNLTWNATEIQEKECGLIIEESTKDILEKVLFLMQPQVNEKFRKNCLEYRKTFDYENIFKTLFQE